MERKYVFEGDEAAYTQYLETLVDQGTRFNLGLVQDRQAQPWVTVQRQFGTAPSDVPPWQVVVVDDDLGTYYALMSQHTTLRVALVKGHQVLDELRKNGPAKQAYDRIKARRSTPPPKGL